MADAEAPTAAPEAAAAGITAVLADFLALLGAFFVLVDLVDCFVEDLALDFELLELDFALPFWVLDLELDLELDFFWALLEVFDSWAKISETGIANAKQTSVARSRWRMRERIQENMTKAQKIKSNINYIVTEGI